MASQIPPPNPQADGGAIHNDQELCQHLLRNLNRSVALEILPSRIHNNGTGLFAMEAIPEGSEIFRSTPLVNCVRSAKHAKGEVMVLPKISLCTQCGVCGYCSKDCQAKALEKYHKSECEALKRSPSADLWTRMLYRVLAMHKQGTYSEQEWQALHHLCGNQRQNNSVFDSHKGIDISKGAKTSIQSKLGNEAIQDLFCKVLTNVMCINHQEGSPGITLDLVGSFVNHSCDPNAFVFFEGSQLRMRSLKPINAGDEITLTYTELREGVLMRKRKLHRGYSFFCRCNRCKKEHKELHELSFREGFSIRDFIDTEIKFDNLKNQAFSNRYTIDQVETILAVLTRAIFPTRPWPDTLLPMSSMKFCFARLYSSSNNHRQAAIHALQGCLATTNRSGPEWVDFLHTFLRYFAAFIVAPSAAEDDIPDPHKLQYFFNGLLKELLIQGSKVYGMDARYTIALVLWYADVLNTMEPPLPGEEGFADIFGSAQASVLRWVGVDEGMGVDLLVLE
ncbi:hypothetical protein GMDG_01733 [Pseudogymnoascus destructans 20631-21]|uniref:Uncharacterized protein n=1 Tax=Pseudogymnoascus destructans (strain ATCC MYA-4855 / 20631-21) TaxID=658429 RepID=L8FY71_PSED2|nr:hypothetical protein GMDG_01733 [Pseudogymnoascus destructans 20631-21]